MYDVQLDKYELEILKSLVRSEYKKLSDIAKSYSGSDRDVFEDSKSRLLSLTAKLDNIKITGDN